MYSVATFPELALVLRERMGSTGSIWSLRQVLSNLANAPAWTGLTDSVLSDSECVSRIASGSYEHANGFDKLVLLDLSPQLLVRLHIWWPSERADINEPVGHIHSHSWDFSSVVLTGQILAEHFTECTAAPESCADIHTMKYQYHPEGSGRLTTSGRNYELKECGASKVTRNFVSQLGAGTSYTLSHEVLHRIAPDPRTVTATLVVQGPVTTDSNEVHALGPLAVDRGAPIPIRHFDSGEVRSKLIRLKDAIASFNASPSAVVIGVSASLTAPESFGPAC